MLKAIGGLSTKKIVATAHSWISSSTTLSDTTISEKFVVLLLSFRPKAFTSPPMDLNDLFQHNTPSVDPLYKQWVIQHNSALRQRLEDTPIPKLTHEEVLAHQTQDGKKFKIVVILGVILWVVIFGGLF